MIIVSQSKPDVSIHSVRGDVKNVKVLDAMRYPENGTARNYHAMSYIVEIGNQTDCSTRNISQQSK